MCGCGGSKDQTPEDAVAVVKAAVLNRGIHPQDVAGTGIFLVPAPEVGILEYRTVVVKNTNYDDVRKRGANCIAFKFLPHEFVAEAEVTAMFANERERSRRCIDFCNFAGGRCPWGCWCPPDSNFCR